MNVLAASSFPVRETASGIHKAAPELVEACGRASYSGARNPNTVYDSSKHRPHDYLAAQVRNSSGPKQSGINIDGVIALDPVAVSRSLGTVGSAVRGTS